MIVDLVFSYCAFFSITSATAIFVCPAKGCSFETRRVAAYDRHVFLHDKVGFVVELWPYIRQRLSGTHLIMYNLMVIVLEPWVLTIDRSRIYIFVFY